MFSEVMFKKHDISQWNKTKSEEFDPVSCFCLFHLIRCSALIGADRGCQSVRFQREGTQSWDSWTGKSTMKKSIHLPRGANSTLRDSELTPCNGTICKPFGRSRYLFVTLVKLAISVNLMWDYPIRRWRKRLPKRKNLLHMTHVDLPLSRSCIFSQIWSDIHILTSWMQPWHSKYPGLSLTHSLPDLGGTRNLITNQRPFESRLNGRTAKNSFRRIFQNLTTIFFSPVPPRPLWVGPRTVQKALPGAVW